MYIHVPRTGGNSVQTFWPNTEHAKHMSFAKFTYLHPEAVNCFSFGFTRNPWERMFSHYTYARNKGHQTATRGFKHWLMMSPESWPNNNKKPIWPRVCAVQQLLHGVDHIAKFENFNEEWLYIFNRIGIPPTTIPHINQSTHDERYQDNYDNEMIRFVSRYHNTTIKHGKYVFGD